MIWNIVDRRYRNYRWAKVNAVIEDVRNDNSCEDTDTFDDENENAPVYDKRSNISLHEAITWAETETGRVTPICTMKVAAFNRQRLTTKPPMFV